MEYVAVLPITNLAQWKVNQINRCLTTPQFYVSVEGWRFDNEIRTALYMIEIGVRTEDNVLLFMTEMRYSELRIITKGLPGEKSLPFFPPKKFFGSTSIEFVKSRHISLKKYFERISSIKKIDQINEFEKLFHFSAIRDQWDKYRNCIEY